MSMNEAWDTDLLILGAGPAGLCAAQYGSRANLSTLVVEEMAPGGQALNIDILENYPGNVAHGDLPPRSGFEFSADLHKQAEDFGAKFIMEGAVSLRREGAASVRENANAGGFALSLSGGGTLRAPAVILATGAVRRTLDIPGEQKLAGRGVSYCATCDGPFFKGKRMLVAGGGDSACDEAQYLSRLSADIVLVHRKGKLRAQKALADRVLSNPNISVRFHTQLVEIRGEEKVRSVVLDQDGTLTEEPFDAVFVFIGSLPRTELVRDMKDGPELDESGYVITDQRMASSVPGLFAAGDVRSGPFRQVVVAAGEGAVAAHCAALYIDALRGEVYR